MRAKDLHAMGVPAGKPTKLAQQAVGRVTKEGATVQELRQLMRAIVDAPKAYLDDPVFAEFALQLAAARLAQEQFQPRARPAPHRSWGSNLEEQAVQQMANACDLPISIRGALMADAHVGYGLPIGGVLATDTAVIPYAVGVDIACRVRMSVYDMPPETLESGESSLKKAIDSETRFGIGSNFERPRQHAVLDANWDVSPVTKKQKSKARKQLGTSGSGNHFVEFGVLEVGGESRLELPAGQYLALLSHSGSRGTGAQVANHYSKLAQARHPELPERLRHLAWLDLASDEGQEYWAAMELMGEYAAANHECIHRHMAAHLGAEVIFSLENHHNFAWKEIHDGVEQIVHRKGATPAATGVLGIIPGSMASPTYLVCGKGEPSSLNSAAHGAGRLMSRKAAKKSITWDCVRPLLKERGVQLMTAGIDEAPMVYKDIDKVMAAQSDLVESIAMFLPRLVKMAPGGERPED